MAEDLHKDNLESFFKETFDEQSDQPSKEGWDVPSDRVWNAVNEAINPDDDSKGGFIWFKYLWLGAMALIFTIAGIIFFMSDRTQDQATVETTEEKTSIENHEDLREQGQSAVIESEAQSGQHSESNSTINKEELPVTSEKISGTTENSSSNNNQKSDLNAKNNSTTTSSPTTKNDERPSTIENNSGSIKTTKDQKPNTSPADRGNDSDKPEPPTDQDVEKNKVTTKKKAIATDDSNDNSINDPVVSGTEFIGSELNQSDSTSNLVDLPTIELLDAIPTKDMLVQLPVPDTDTLALIEPFTDLDKKSNTDTGKKNGFYVGLSIAPTITFRKIKVIGNPVIPSDLNMNEKAGFSFATGLTLGYKISDKWSIETGFTYSKLSIQHNRRKQVQYTSIGEQDNGQGEFQREYAFALNTSGGDVATDVALARSSGTTIQENEFITLRIKADQNISFGTIPIIARYSIGKGDFKLGLKAGLVNRFAFDGYFKVTDVQTVRNGIRPILNDRVFRKRPMQNFKKYQVDYLFGIGLNYHLSDKLWIQLEPTVSRSINPMFENQNYKTFPLYRSVDLRVNYLF